MFTRASDPGCTKVVKWRKDVCVCVLEVRSATVSNKHPSEISVLFSAFSSLAPLQSEAIPVNSRQLGMLAPHLPATCCFKQVDQIEIPLEDPCVPRLSSKVGRLSAAEQRLCHSASPRPQPYSTLQSPMTSADFLLIFQLVLLMRKHECVIRTTRVFPLAFCVIWWHE